MLTGAAFVVLAFLPEPDATLFWGALYDLGHVLLFAVVCMLLQGLPGTGGGGRTFAVALALGVASELLQLGQMDRDASVSDVLRDATGAAVFLLMKASLGSQRRPDSGRLATLPPWTLRAAAGILLILVTIPFLVVCGVYVQRDRAFPTLCRFDGSWWERQLISTGSATLVTSVAPPGRPISGRGPSFALLMLRPALYPGFVYDEPYPDWTGFQHLVFTVVSPEETPLILTIRIHDRAHDQRFEDRFNRRIVIHPGENLVSISLEEIRIAPVDREMDLRHIRGIAVYAHQLQRPVRIYISQVVLQ